MKQGRAASGSVEQHRHFEIGPNSKDSKVRTNFPSNTVSTTKYELWNIIPKNLFEQFQRCANIWFLIVSICQMLPFDLSPTAPYATILPLSLVLLITFCKDAYEDWGRRRDDTFVNNQFCTVVDCSGGMVLERETRWRDVEVGNYLKLDRDAPVPADIVLLSSAHEDGVAYVDTVQLDGEMSLKPKFALEETMAITDVNDLGKLQGHVDTELPNELVQTFNGTLHLRGHPRGLPIDIKNFILRGSTIRNTAWVLGLVVFSGVDTKLVMNSKGTPSKKSRVEEVSNRLLLIVFGLLCTASVISAIARALTVASGEGNANLRWVWPELDEVEDNDLLAFITFMIGFNNFIPISLYVTTDLVRTFQARVMERDRSMYHELTDSHCRVKNSALNENLGQVEFILTDKTGTLTENKMVFKACSAGDKVYGCWDQSKGPVNDVVQVPPSSVCVPIDSVLRDAPKPKVAITADEEQLLEDLFLCLATCHTAIVEEMTPEQMAHYSSVKEDRPSKRSSINPEKKQKPPTDPLHEEAWKTNFRSSSPDEEALVTAARAYGFFFRRRAANRIVVNVRGEDRHYTVLVLNEFSSERKRMSVLVRRTHDQDHEDCDRDQAETKQNLENSMSSSANPTGCGADVGVNSKDGSGTAPQGLPHIGRCVLYAKGADNVMLDRLSESEKTHATSVQTQLKAFSQHGLRTLICARRELDEEQAVRFETEMHDAKTALINREKNMEEVADRMERDMVVLGVTAIEDKIQQGVPETVNQLLRAGVKVWMLTGDNMETAINIGLACKLSTPTTRQYILDGQSNSGSGTATPKELWNLMDGYFCDIRKELKEHGKSFGYCFVVHGSVLYTIMEENRARLRQLFLAIACASESVIACRLAPAQKAALVKLVRTGILGNPLTLAIGDGGNDVSMIQEAHVGVGIRGVEGQQAANAADFVISQFRFLRPLLFVHGSRNLRRIGIVIAYSFYKNCVLVLPMVVFAFFTGFTGTTLYDSYLLMCYNIVTFLPILIVGVFDFHVPVVIAQAVPTLYQLGIQGVYWNSRMLIGWLFRGVWHAIIIFFTMRWMFTGAQTCDDRVPDHQVMGSWAFWACVSVVNAILALHLKAWMDWLFFNIIISVLCFIPGMMIYSQTKLHELFTPTFVGVSGCLFTQLNTWLGLLFVTGICSLIELAISSILREVQPTAADILLEVSLGYVTGIDELLAKYEESRSAPATSICNAAWSDYGGYGESAECSAQTRECLSQLPPPPIHIYRVRPEGGVKVEPLEDPACSAKRGKELKLKGVVPTEKAEGIVDDYHARQSVVSIPQTRATRMQQMLTAMTNWIWKQQWHQINVRDMGNAYNIEEWDKNLTAAVKSTKGHSQRQSSRPSLDDDEALHLNSNQGGSRRPSISSQSQSSDPLEKPDPSQMMDLLYSLVTLRFFKEDKEFLFRQYFSDHAVQLFKKSLTALTASLLFYNMYEIVAYEYVRTAARIAMVISIIPIGFAGAYVLKTQIFEAHAESFIVSILVMGMVCKHLYDVVIGNDGILANSYVPVFYTAGTRLPFPYVCSVLILHVMLLSVRYLMLSHAFTVQSRFPVLEDGDQLRAEYFVLMVGLTSFSIYSAYLLETLMRQEFMLLEMLRQSKHQAMEILRNMFPEEVVNHVVAQMQREQKSAGSHASPGTVSPSVKPSSIREDRGIVTIVFCDFCDFDNLTSTLQPVELVQLLDLVWALFDRICDRHSVHKIETVGKTYMCAAMPEDPNVRQHDKRDVTAAIETAIGMLEAVAKRALGVGKITKVQVRIGIHSGKALSGVVGSRKPQFALFGDTVNTASRMCSTGVDDCVHVSSNTWEHIKDDPRFQWDARKVDVKGKFVMDTYLLQQYDLRSKELKKTKSSQLAVPDRGGDRSQSRTGSKSGNATPSGTSTGTVSSDSCSAREQPSPPPPLPENPPPPVSQPQTVIEAPPHEESAKDKKKVDGMSDAGRSSSTDDSAGRTIATSAAAFLFGQHDGSFGSSKKNPKGQPEQDVKSICISFLAFWSCYAGVSLCILLRREPEGHTVDIAFRLGYLALTLAAGIIFYCCGWKRRKGFKGLGATWIFSTAIAAIVFVGFISSFSSNSIASARSEFWGVFEAFFFATVLMHLCRVHLQGSVPATLCVLVLIIVAARLIFDKEYELMMESFVYFFMLSGTQLLAIQGDPRRSRKDHNAIAEEHKRVNQLLDSMLPCEVLAEMKQGRLSLAYEYEDVTFLFADIVGFTKYCAAHSAEQAVNLVTRLFADFDECTVNLGVYKVCTIGDAYVVVNEPRAVQPDAHGDCEKVFNMAKKMLQIIIRVRTEVNHDDLDMRIGLHFGRFIGGVIGTKRLRFDVWGEDVLIGNSIESNGKAGKICVSQQAKEVLEKCGSIGHQLSFQMKSDITLKNKRVVRCYLCTRGDT